MGELHLFVKTADSQFDSQMIEIVQGLAYLHGVGIVHGALRGVIHLSTKVVIKQLIVFCLEQRDY